MHTYIEIALKTNFMSSLLYRVSCISSSTIRILNLYIESPKIFAYYIWSKKLSSSLYAMLKPSKMKSPQKLFDYDCMTLYKEYHKLI